MKADRFADSAIGDSLQQIGFPAAVRPNDQVPGSVKLKSL